MTHEPLTSRDVFTVCAAILIERPDETGYARTLRAIHALPGVGRQLTACATGVLQSCVPRWRPGQRRGLLVPDQSAAQQGSRFSRD